MRAVAFALLWIVGTIGGVVLLATISGAGAAVVYLIACVIAGLWHHMRV
jgi:hypothetical protein